MTSWAAHHSTTRELEAMTGRLRELITVAWQCQQTYRSVGASARSDKDRAYWRGLEHHATDSLRDLLSLKKAARAARRRT